ncbi:ubiquinone biosynthesis accessory factor UbiJ [Pseudoalteromonas sp. SSM20]|uniref:ubiquinone biosynthesis accessory factor UbiJ n=1 Tax=Pseudoalteromonas sp. SSM20 TaxID=3139394 RepID=UPI003BA8FDDF
MVSSLIAASIEQLLNRLIKLDNEFINDLTPAVRQQLTVEVTDLNAVMTVIFDGAKFHILPNGDASSDCFISADLNTLLELKKPENVTQLIRSGKLNLDGDLNLAQHYSKAFNNLDIDWADNLSRYFGDGPASTLVNFIKQTTHKLKQQRKITETTITSLLQDELKVSIHPLEAQLFKQHCRALQQNLAQLEQRVDKLKTVI